ncbi:MAG: hypothetical protein U0Q22_16900 [Acidimicrobiales bacterium]
MTSARRGRPGIPVAALAVAAVLLGGCSSSDDEARATTTVAASATTATGSSRAPGTIPPAQLTVPAPTDVQRYVVTSTAEEYTSTFTQPGTYDGANLGGTDYPGPPRWTAAYGSAGDTGFIVTAYAAPWTGHVGGGAGEPVVKLGDGRVVAFHYGTSTAESYDAAIATLTAAVTSPDESTLPDSLGPSLPLLGTQTYRPDVWVTERRTADGTGSFQWTITAQTFSPKVAYQVALGELSTFVTYSDAKETGIHTITQGPTSQRECIIRPLGGGLVLSGCRVGPLRQVDTSANPVESPEDVALRHIVAAAVVTPG